MRLGEEGERGGRGSEGAGETAQCGGTFGQSGTRVSLNLGQRSGDDCRLQAADCGKCNMRGRSVLTGAAELGKQVTGTFKLQRTRLLR